MAGFRDRLDRIIVWSSRPPILQIRQVVWIVTAGWALFLAYAFAALGMCATIIFIPFGVQAFEFAWFALDPITKEPYSEQTTLNPKSKPWSNPAHPLTVAANVVWLLLFGWGIVCLHVAAGIVNILTVIGISTGITQFKLAAFAVWPFGRKIRRKFLPTSLEELHAHRAQSKQAQPSGRPVESV